MEKILLITTVSLLVISLTFSGAFGFSGSTNSNEAKSRTTRQTDVTREPRLEIRDKTIKDYCMTTVSYMKDFN